MTPRLLPFFFFLLISASNFAQTKTVAAVKATLAPKIDGDLNDVAWQNAPVAQDFIQNFPTYNAKPTAVTEVRILYDNEAVYIGAYLYDEQALIRKQLTTRDDEQQKDVDYFSVFFDTYNDQQNGFQFLVTSANVQTDAKLGGSAATGFGNFGDRAWDAVWQSSTSIKNNGWVVEMRIPYISLRFSKKEMQTWGLQFLRSIRRNNESSYWNAVDPKEAGFINQFGKYADLKNIQPPLRLSFSPYLSGGIRFNPAGSRIKEEWLRSGGMDVKWGTNESFTLDATLIPDFGQVISDNVVNNLTPFEVRFQENRLFFTEGTELFNKSGLFYSRRIGATPLDYFDVEDSYRNSQDYLIKRNPSVTKLYNAIKFSGRTKNKTGLGVFNAVTAPMKAELVNRNTGKDSTIQTEPLTNYNMVVVDKAFKGRSYITFTNANVVRNGATRDANTSAFDFGLFNKTNTYSFRGTARYSKIFGLTPYSMIQYTPYSFISSIDTTRVGGRLYAKPYDGFTTNLRYGKVSGRVQYYGSVNIESQAYDANDLGYFQAPNEVNYTAFISYNQFEPTKTFFNYNYSLQLRYNWLYQPYKFSSIEVNANGFWLFKNMWDVRLIVGAQPEWQRDYFELRTPGKVVQRPWYGYVFFSGSTDSRKRLYVDWDFGFADGAIENNPYYSTALGLRYRFSNQLSANLSMNRTNDNNQIGFVGRETNGEPIAGFRDFIEYSTVASITYNFTSKVSFTGRSRHYWSNVEYNRFINTDDHGNHIDRAFISGRDFVFNAYNLDAFFNWDFRPASRIVAGWKNYLGSDYEYQGNPMGKQKYLNNFRKTFDLPHGNEITLRIIYFLDYSQLQRKS